VSASDGTGSKPRPARNGLPVSKPYVYRGPRPVLDERQARLLRLLDQAPGGMTDQDLANAMRPRRPVGTVRMWLRLLLQRQLVANVVLGDGSYLVITDAGRQVLAEPGPAGGRRGL